jgi:DivIVA domain-containing protein
MLSADDVLNSKFEATKFRDGYDQDEVDDFLDRVVATLRARETGASVRGPVTVGELDSTRFQRTKFREGYDTDGVDGLLAEVRQTLDPSAPRAPTAPDSTPASTPTAPDASATPGLIEPTKGWRRFFGG